MTKNADPDIYFYSRYAIGLDARGSFSLFNGNGFGKNIKIFVADISWSLYIDNKKKDILILGKVPTDGLGDITFTTENKYSINFFWAIEETLFKFAL